MSDQKPRRGPLAVEQVEWEAWSQGERFAGRVRVLSDTREGGMKIGVLVEELPPGRQSCPLHYHMVEEEHVLILEGAVTLRLGEDRIPLRVGDFVSFPAGRAEGHCLVNETDAPCRYLVIGDNDPNEVCVYPDSNKVMVGALRRAGLKRIFDAAATRDYWDGERADEKP
ncbi:MAG: cupin domain-containing protein [Myxococcales bacterium]|nr:cupin domain-containing protein [Myxococcales bacterium]